MTDGPRVFEEGTYEMLWDCKYCGQKKNLGLTHRHCGGCGGPQDPTARYFPEEHEKVAVKDHPFVGADVTCPACQQAQARGVKCCTGCGRPLDDAAQVATRADVVQGPPPAAYPAPPAAVAAPPTPARSSSKVGCFVAIGGVLLVGLALVLTVVFWKRESALEVTGHRWERSIEVERFDLVAQSAWCEELPAGASTTRRYQADRGTKSVPDGETCQTRKKDMGNGTFKQVKECTPKTKSIPVKADKCDYQLPAWAPARTAKETGSSTSGVKWPATGITRTGASVGAEREGKRSEKFSVVFRDAKKGTDVTCHVDQGHWESFKKGDRYTGKVGVLSDDVDCSELSKM